MEFRQIYEAIALKLTNYLVGSGASYAEACDLVPCKPDLGCYEYRSVGMLLIVR